MASNIDELLTRLLKVEDTRLVEMLHKDLVQQVNDVRQEHGLEPAREPSVVLHPPETQLQVASVANEVGLGHAILTRAAGDEPDEGRCMFTQFFIRPDVAQRYRDQALLEANRAFSRDTTVTLFPPLLARAIEARSLGLDGLCTPSGFDVWGHEGVLLATRQTDRVFGCPNVLFAVRQARTEPRILL